MKAVRRKPDYEAGSIVVKAGSITYPEYNHGRNTHGRNRSVAHGDVDIVIKKQHPGARDKTVRPPPGTVLSTNDDSEVIIEGRKFVKATKTKDGTGRKRMHVSGAVEIFGKLKRSRP